MNFIFRPGSYNPLKPREIAEAANDASGFRPFTEEDFAGTDNERIQGVKCQCNGNGDFELLPPRPGLLRRVVKCRYCGTEMLL